MTGRVCPATIHEIQCYSTKSKFRHHRAGMGAPSRYAATSLTGSTALAAGLIVLHTGQLMALPCPVQNRANDARQSL